MNETIFYFFYNLAHHSQFFDKVVVFLAVYFPYLVILMAGLFLLFCRKNWRELFLVFFSGGLAVFIDLLLKYLIHASRPFLTLANVHPLFLETGYAFPSGHATLFSALAVSLFFLDKKIGYIFIFFALLIGLARIIVGIHFPIDILGGFVLGAFIVYLVRYFVKTS